MPTIIETADAIASLRTTAQAMIESAQRQAARAADLNPIAWVDWPAALDEARRLDAEAKAGRRRGPLHGVAVSVKDLFAVRGMPTLAGTRAPLPPLGRDEAEAVSRLRAAGALVFAKANMHEIALGATGETRCPRDGEKPAAPQRPAGGACAVCRLARALPAEHRAVTGMAGGALLRLGRHLIRRLRCVGTGFPVAALPP